MQLAINVWKWPGMNVAFLFSFFLTNAMAFASIPFAKRRPKGTPLSWGEAMLAAVYVFATLFLAFGVVPHQWIQHSDGNLHWTAQRFVYGPFDLLKSKALGGHFPFNVPYQAIRDIVVVVIHAYFFGVIIFLWSKWQKRGQTTSTEIATSTYGRPLVKKA